MALNKNTLITEKSAPAPVDGTGIVASTSKHDPNQPSNLNTANVNNTTLFFNNFFTLSGTVSENVDDAIVGFFQTQTQDETAGKLLAAAVINTALQQKEDPMAVMDQFRKLGPGELDVYLALYLNLSRVNTSLIGVKNQPRANKYVRRTIIK